MAEKVKDKKLKVAWGITGAGDKIAEIVEVMKDLKKQSEDKVEIDVFISKAADTMLKFYRLEDEIKRTFPKSWLKLTPTRRSSQRGFKAANMNSYSSRPASSNTVAKIVNSISDTMLTNAAIMSLKAFRPVYILPTDYRESVVSTILPNGKEMKLRVRKEEADQVRKLEATEDVHVLESPQKMKEAFLEWLKTLKT